MLLIEKIRYSLFQKGVDVDIIDGKLQVPIDDKREVEMFLMGFNHAQEVLDNINFT